MEAMDELADGMMCCIANLQTLYTKYDETDKTFNSFPRSTSDANGV